MNRFIDLLTKSLTTLKSVQLNYTKLRASEKTQIKSKHVNKERKNANKEIKNSTSGRQWQLT